MNRVSGGNLFRGRPFQNGGPGGRPPLRATGVSPTIEESWALQDFARECGTILEIGTAWGYSAILMALSGAMVWSVDPHTDHGTWDELQKNLGEYRVRERVTAYRVRSQDALPSWLAQGALWDGAFVDGDHSYEAARFDIESCLHLVRPGGLLAVHDYTEAWPGVYRACEERLADLEPRRVVDTLLIVKLPELPRKIRTAPLDL